MEGEGKYLDKVHDVKVQNRFNTLTSTNIKTKATYAVGLIIMKYTYNARSYFLTLCLVGRFSKCVVYCVGGLVGRVHVHQIVYYNFWSERSACDHWSKLR